MLKFRKCITLFLFFSLPALVWAVEPINSETENRVYVDLIWELNKNIDYFPGVAIGIRSMRLDSNHFNNGADLSLFIKLKNEKLFNSLRLLYVGGDRDNQINLGGGYSFSKNTNFISAFFEVPNIRIGTNYLINSSEFDSNFELNSLGRIGDFSECPYSHYRVVPVTYQQTVGNRVVQKTKHICEALQ